MKRIILYTFCIIVFNTTAGCSQSNTNIKPDNKELQELYNSDQRDRSTGNIDWKIVSPRDSARRVRVYELLDSNKVSTSLDYSNAAMIFQHGESRMAVKLMRKAVELDTTISKWLLAAAIDRDLMRRNFPQIYGTQYLRENNKWVQYKIDTTKITDKERIEYNVETLAQQREKFRLMNK